MKLTEDHALIAQYLKGDEKALELLIQKYLGQMYRFVLVYAKNPEAAQDITQEIFVKVWKNAKRVDSNKNFKSWLYTVAKNTALDYLKQKKAVPFSVFETPEGKNALVESLLDTTDLPDKNFELIQQNQQFMAAIGKLSEKYRTVLTLYYYQYLNFREIAQKLKEPLNTIKSRHRRGLLLLKKTFL